MRLHCGPVTDSWTHRLKYRTTPKRCEIFGSGRTPFFVFERLDPIDAVEEDCRSGPLPFCKYFGDRRNAPFVLTAISGTQSRLHHFAIILFFRRIPKLLWLQFLLQVVRPFKANFWYENREEIRPQLWGSCCCLSSVVALYVRPQKY